MEIKEIKNKQAWEGFLMLCQQKTFLQSWNWGEFQVSLGNSIWRFGIYEGTALVSVALTIKHTAKRSNFLLIPHGPVVVNQESYRMKLVLQTLMVYLKRLAKNEKVDFIRMNPIWQRTLEHTAFFTSLGFRLRPLHTH